MTDTRRPTPTTGTATQIATYTRAAHASSAQVIGVYSTSFGLACRLLAARERRQVGSIYALVRIADEIVDGAASQAGLPDAAQRAALDGLEDETLRAIETGFSTNLIVHAFADTARATGIDARLTTPFFASMRRDLDPAPFDAAGIADYIYGSAEVVGLMCLRSFLQESERTETELATLTAGARSLGAAFQKVNFLRDIAADRDDLGRNYFPGVNLLTMTDEEKDFLLDDMDADLNAAARALPLLPRGNRRAVAAAHGLFASLAVKLRGTPARGLLNARVRVPDPEKLTIALGAALGPGAWKK
ncbi:squalene/phytoene synthase family protein [Cryobacterium sp. GrIS_2_6]|uniref:phytoene/squalene synthase family protein n=1 Tax=Cryobacterium sp. GrIS_2_6 TaxID=3162785 RepID=UPI002E03BE78|nr:squalene/phytoene synthase family protein [Cryobacterium psychrotolerans]MEC5150046.1 phytoene/squalene synthetase [Cryobacterium psychrotolerans]